MDLVAGEEEAGPGRVLGDFGGGNGMDAAALVKPVEESEGREGKGARSALTEGKEQPLLLAMLPLDTWMVDAASVP